MKLSLFGEKYTQQSGIVELMDDMGNSMLINPDMVSMGGGNPARIPEVEEIFHRHIQRVISEPDGLHAMLGRYQPPQGDEALLREVAGFLRNECGWQVSAGNIAVSNGGQSAFYVLSNILAGRFPDGSFRQILMPLAPEYLGYTDTGMPPEEHSKRPQEEGLTEEAEQEEGEEEEG